MMVGDNPAVTRGVPVTVDWETLCEYQLGLEEYEDVRPPRRFKMELKMESLDRVRLLKRLGFARSEIMQGSKEAGFVRDRRQRTRKSMNFAGLHEVLERMARAVLNATIRRSSKKREKQLLEQCRCMFMDESITRTNLSSRSLGLDYDD